ncbi:MAG: isochorismatase family protein [Burkholderiales bacterium]|nr:isochorismatase family protein [Burkholderiales bacterium]
MLKKRQSSLYFHTPFHHHMRAKDIRIIVVGGFATDWGVESTVRYGDALAKNSVLAKNARAAQMPGSLENCIEYLLGWVASSSASRHLLVRPKMHESYGMAIASRPEEEK